MNYETAANIADSYDNVMQLLKQFNKPEAKINFGSYPGTYYVSTVDGDFHRVQEWNTFADKATGGNMFYHVH